MIFECPNFKGYISPQTSLFENPENCFLIPEKTMTDR